MDEFFTSLGAMASTTESGKNWAKAFLPILIVSVKATKLVSLIRMGNSIFLKAALKSFIFKGVFPDRSVFVSAHPINANRIKRLLR